MPASWKKRGPRPPSRGAIFSLAWGTNSARDRLHQCALGKLGWQTVVARQGETEKANTLARLNTCSFQKGLLLSVPWPKPKNPKPAKVISAKYWSIEFPAPWAW